MITSKHLKKTIKEDYRMIVISDIHGHLDRFKSLLQKIKYTPDDYLIILGDFVEKGDQVIETIHFIQQLDLNKRTYVLAGNCEWALDALLTVPELAKEIPNYLKRVSSNGCIRQVYHKLHLDDGTETMLGVQKRIAEYLKDELSYISHLPVTLKINQFLFVHAGIEKRKDYQKSSLSSMLEMQYFYEQGHLLNEIVVVGHLPTSNYSSFIHNDIIIDIDKRMICIDGGTGVKPVSQLNALIIESKDNHISYKKEYVQPLPTCRVKEDVKGHCHSIHKISYPHFEIDVIDKGNQFSLCRQIDTYQNVMIKNEFIYHKHNKDYCLDDYTDYFHTVSKGNKVKVLGIYDEYIYCIYNEQVGWIKKEFISMDNEK